MIRFITRFVFTMSGIILILAVSTAHCVEFEDDIRLNVGDIFPDVAMSGSNYVVEEEVTTDGYLTRTVINSDYGEFTAIGPGMLQIRLHEIDALVKLEDFEATEEFKRGAKESAGEKWKGLKTIVDKPKDTWEGVSAGASRFFKRTVRSTKTGIQKADDLIHERVPGALEGEGPGVRLPGAATNEANVEVSQNAKYEKYEQAALASGQVAVNIFGFADAKRKLAKRLQVDPYTWNKVLSDKLDEVTWAIFAGDLGVDLITSMIPGGAILSSSAMVTDLVWDTSPGDLRVRVEQQLLAMEIPQADVDRLLRHRYYTLTMQAAIATNLEKLQGTEGKADIMELVLSVGSVDQARFVAGTLVMLSRYHEQIGELKEVEVVGTVIGRTESGSVVIAAPADYVSYSESLVQFSERDEFRDKAVEFFIAGRATEQAVIKLTEKGWGVHPDSTIFKR